MKLFVLIIIAFNIINAQTEITVSDLQLTHHQVLGIEIINNKLFIVSFGGGSGPAALDVYDIDKNTIEKDILKNSGETITFGNANLFKDSKNNLWIGDINRLIKLDINGKISNLYYDIKLPDSTYFEIKSVTEDDEGNIYFLKVNTRIIMLEKIDGTKYSTVISDLDLVKYDGNQFNVLTSIEGVFDVRGMKYFDNKIYFSNIKLGVKNIGLYYYDIVNDKLKAFANKFPSKVEIESLDWQSVKRASVDEFFELKGELYANIKIEASMNDFNTFLKINSTTDELTYVNPLMGDDIIGVYSYNKLSEKVFCSTNSTENDINKLFMIFKNGKFEYYNITNEIKPTIITNHGVKSQLENYNWSFESGRLGIQYGLKLLENGTLIGGTSFGLIFIENFQELSSTVEKQEVKIKTNPELTSVQNELYIESEFKINSYKVFDINSKTIQTKSNLKSISLNLNLESLTIGIYFIELETQEGKTLLKFIKN